MASNTVEMSCQRQAVPDAVRTSAARLQVWFLSPREAAAEVVKGSDIRVAALHLSDAEGEAR